MISLGIAGLIIGLCCYNSFATMARGTFPMPFGIGSAIVLSGSMEPELSVNDLVLVKREDKYEENQYVVYYDGKINVVHEIIKIEGDEITTKGTANDFEDTPINVDKIYGRVFFVIPKVGVVVSFLQNPVIFIAITALIVFLIWLSYNKEGDEKKKQMKSIKDEIEILKNEIYNKKDG